jgi:sugar lactone lactonase YvrE
MNLEHSRRLTTHLSGAAVFILLAGCSAGTTSLPAQNTVAGPATHVVTQGSRTQSKLYVSTIDGGSVIVYAATGAPDVLQTITDGVPRPQGIWVDRHNVLYAVNVPGSSYQTSLPEYKNGESSPFQTITDGIVNCSDVAVDRKGNVYVTGLNTANGDLFLEIYSNGATAPSETLTVPSNGLSAIAGLAFDSSGALLVGETTGEGSSGAVYRLRQGSKKFVSLGLLKAPGGIITVDEAGNIYLGGNSGIAEYAPNQTKPSSRLRVQFGVSAIAIDRAGELYVGTFGGVSEYAPHAKKPMATFDVPGHVGGLALGS